MARKTISKGSRRWIELWQLDHDKWQYAQVRAAEQLQPSWYVPLGQAWPQDEFTTLATIWEMFSSNPPCPGLRKLQHGDMVVLCARYPKGVTTAAYVFASKEDMRSINCLADDAVVQILSDRTIGGKARGTFASSLGRPNR